MIKQVVSSIANMVSPDKNSHLIWVDMEVNAMQFMYVNGII